jgi:DNA (cytosine-5)-methyltransferase 1
LKTAEIFCGAGGLAIGFSKADFTHEFILDFNNDACNTLRKNRELGYHAFQNCSIYEEDAKEFDLKKIKSNIDVISGGPPCQPFSIGGKHKGSTDERDMFPVAVKAITELKPKCFVFENVFGILRESFSHYFNYILLRLTYPEFKCKNSESWFNHLRRLEKHHTSSPHKGLNYNVVFRLLNASHFGVPQNRKRVFIVGFRNDLNIEWSFPKETHSLTSLYHSQYVTEEYWDTYKVSKKERPALSEKKKNMIERLKVDYSLIPPDLLRCNTVRDAIHDLPEPRDTKQSVKFLNHEFKEGAKMYAGHTGSYIDLPAKALKAGDHGVPGGENMVRLPDSTVRYFTVRESCRIQTFPDNYFITGCWSEAMRQLGNAVPVKLASVVAKSILKSSKE